jgi:hypothetical protein
MRSFCGACHWHCQLSDGGGRRRAWSAAGTTRDAPLRRAPRRMRCHTVHLPPTAERQAVERWTRCDRRWVALSAAACEAQGARGTLWRAHKRDVADVKKGSRGGRGEGQGVAPSRVAARRRPVCMRRRQPQCGEVQSDAAPMRSIAVAGRRATDQHTSQCGRPVHAGCAHLVAAVSRTARKAGRTGAHVLRRTGGRQPHACSAPSSRARTHVPQCSGGTPAITSAAQRARRMREIRAPQWPARAHGGSVRRV